MDPDRYQKAWQAHSSETRVTVDANLLLKEVQRNQRDFRASVSRQDFALIGISLLLLPIWIYMGVTQASPWTWYLAVPAFLWVIGFLLVFRARYEPAPNAPDEPLLRCVKESLALVKHRIWLQRNAFWWSILPMAIPLLAFTAHLSWLKFKVGSDALSDVNAFIFVFLLVLLCVIYQVNRRAVRKGSFERRRQELLALAASLGDESTGELATTTTDGCDKSSTMLGRALVATGVSCLVTLVALVLASGKFDSSYGGPPRSSGPDGDALAKLVTQQCQEKNLVGLAAMVMSDGKIEAAAARGERQKGSGVPVEIGDRWHLGGISKSITATMIARLIEAGKMQWSDTVGDIFPEAAVHKDWKPVTLRQLLTDTAGALKNFSIDVRLQTPPLGPERIQARLKAVLDVLATQPIYPPGTKFEYSNVGYVIAGAMAENVTGDTWEDLVKREVFEPLELTESGFGPPKSSDQKLEQPRGHRKVLAGKVSVDDQTDNTPIMGPGATIHMTLENLCNFAREHLHGEIGTGKLLSTESYHRLHAPELGGYACGWLKINPSPALPYTFYWHNGSNTMWYALVVFIPEKNKVIAVTSNDGDFYSAEAAAWEIVKASVNDRNFVPRDSFPKKSPFAAVRWQESLPEVKVGDEWFTLVSLNGIAASDIIAFSRKTYGDKSQKRFEEDLVELLSRMGHPPQDKVKLVVQSLFSLETRIFEDVPMTEENRRAIYDAATAREREEQQQQQKPGPHPPVPIDDATNFRGRINEFLTAARTKAGFSGAVLVARGGKPVYEGAFGFSHLESKVPNTLDTPFRIASLSKQFTAAAIFRLEAQGKLKIDDPVHKYLDEFAKAPYRDITIHHLLTHTSGLPRIAMGFVGPVRWYNMSKGATPVDDYVRLAVKQRLEFEPGAEYEYSNFGFRVLAALIGRVTGREYADYMEQEVFQPLGMKNSGVARITRPPSEARIAEGLTFRRLDRTGEPLYANGEGGRNYGAGYGSGGIYTTANDLLRWDRALAGDDFLSASQKKRLFQPIHDYYACGWIVKKSGLDGRLYQMHGGGNEGFFSRMMRVPEDDLVIIALGNVDGTDALDEAIEQLFRLCRSLPYQDP
jgi:CubicO group peptidase (beta-lactamase class C family)